MGILVVFNHRKDTGKGNENNIEEVKEGLISRKGDFGIFKNLREKVVGK